MGNPNPELHPENLTAPRFQPGQSGNPGGLSKELRAQIAANAEKATRIRAELLDAIIAKIEAGDAVDLDANTLNLVKTSEDRGLGAPTQTLAGDPGAPLTMIERVIVDPKGGE